MKLTVNLEKNSYPIYIENGILARAGKHISESFSGEKIMVISDDNVFPLYGETSSPLWTPAAMNVIPSSFPMVSLQKASRLFLKFTAPCSMPKYPAVTL